MLKSESLEIGIDILQEVGILAYAELSPTETAALERLREAGARMIAAGMKPITGDDDLMVRNIIGTDKNLNRMFLDNELAGRSMPGCQRALGRIGNSLAVASLLNNGNFGPELKTLADFRAHAEHVKVYLRVYQERLKPLIESPSTERDNDTVETQNNC